MRRLISSGAGLLFKGSGFYITDYRSDSYKKAEKADSKDSSKKSEGAEKKGKSESASTSKETAKSG